ncbi:MAG: type II secretion system protein [Gemmataceae bacterium]
MQDRSQVRRRKGLTLMELVVVLTILVGLAAILVPLFPNLLRRTHKATDATQTAEVAKAVQLYQGTYSSYPNDWDLMTDGTTTANLSYIPSDGGVPFGGAATIGFLTDNEAAALKRVGITTGHAFATTPGHPTLDPYSNLITAPITITGQGGATPTAVFIISGATPSNVPQEIKNIAARDPSARFVVFGVGTRSSMVGRVMQNAPTSVPQNNNFTPATLYSRVGVIFQVSGVGISTSGGTERARLICACALEDDELESTEKDIVNYYDIAQTGQ